MSGDRIAAGPRTRTSRAGWGWLLLSTAARFYLVFLGALAACALVPMLFGLSGSVVQSGSMEPHISTGDVVLSHAVRADAPTPMGRVITFRAPTGSAKSGLVLHRLVAANTNGTLVTAGDANKDPDSTPLARPNIISSGVLLIPGIGLPSIWVGTGAFLPLGLWVLLTLGALTIGTVDAASRQPPSEIPPKDPEEPAGSGPDLDRGEAAHPSRPPRESIASRLSSHLSRIQIDTGSAAVALVAVFTAVALAMAPLGLAAAAFTARTLSIGNFWGTAGPATRLVFTTSPSASTGGIGFATQPRVSVQDATGASVALSSAPVTLSITTPAGAALTCAANPKNAVEGVATFAGCTINKPGTYTLTAVSGGLSSAVSASFTITVGPASTLVFSTNPSSSSTGGVAFITQPVVAVRDAGSNPVTTGSPPVTLNITNPLGASLTCIANPTNAVAGVATFAGCRIDSSGTYTLTAASSGLTNAVSAVFTIGSGLATQLVFTTSPSASTGGTPFTTQPVAAIQDASGNTVSSSSASVTLSITTPAGATLICSSNPLSAVAGVATFAGCNINKPGTYTLTAVSGGLSSAVSASFTITVGPASTLVFSTNPSSSSTGGIAFITQPLVAIRDAGGNPVTTGSPPVTLNLTNPLGTSLTCTANPTNAVAGVATFAGCRIDKAGTYTLTAVAAGLSNAVSASLIITVGPATKLGFTTSPSSGVTNSSFTTQPVVAVQDAGGNTVTTSSVSVTLSITPPGGGTLNCSSNPRNASSGVATFSNCRINTAGNYTLTAAASGLTNAVSNSFTIAGTATKVAFTTNPSGSTSSTAFITQPIVTLQDANGYRVTNSNASVTLTITTPAGAILTCSSNTLNSTSGVAAFSGCRIDKTGTYTLTATSGSLNTAASTSFTITPGTATKLAFTTSPSNSTSGTAFATQPVLAVQDAAGNTTTGTNPLTLTITTPAGATLTCSANPANAVSGVATFAGCSINKTGTYTLTAASSGLTNSVSTSFTITPGAATQLVFTTSPSVSAAGTAFGTQPVVTVQDASGNTVTSSTALVTLSITTPAGATLSCSANPKNAVAGVATFAGCSINTAGTYTLTAAASGLTTAVSASFTITAPATKLAFARNPSNSGRDQAFNSQPVVTVQDAGGNTVTSSNASVTLTVTPPGGPTFTCNANPVNAVAGVATFAGCRLDASGTYTLTASASGLTNAVSTSFTITGGG